MCALCAWREACAQAAPTQHDQPNMRVCVCMRYRCQLAGSERLDKSKVTGNRATEAKHINKSLSCLGDVIAARANKRPHVPYRNSTLTYVLQDSLEGDSKTVMIAQISPAESNSDESYCTLNFASRVRKVELGQVWV